MKLNEIGFANSKIGLMLDAMGERYGAPPSKFLGYHPLDGRGLLLNLAIATAGALRQEGEISVEGQYRRKQSSWDKDALEDIRRNMM